MCMSLLIIVIYYCFNLIRLPFVKKIGASFIFIKIAINLYTNTVSNTFSS